MQPATPSTVLGNFHDVTVQFNGVKTRFFREGSRFKVRTDGADGVLHDYEIDFTFGVAPLQQYLIAFPDGRLQALTIAWDSRPRSRGGQRWFSLYPEDQVNTSRDRLHWTGLDQNWNFMCADCHSTNLRKNYNSRAATFATSYAELDVACEACHGPGSNHIEWAKQNVDSRPVNATKGLSIALNERQGIGWTPDPVTGNPRRSAPRQAEREIGVCARCHSHRAQIHEDYVHGQPVGDDYRVSLLDDDLYFADGQIKGEVYEYGSFIQSRMFQAGVTCSDCHEPHSLKLRAEGNGVCLQCHLVTKYDSPQHHFHKRASAGAQCVDCHMPTRSYMVVDARRDHSIRVPRPDLTLTLGTPNACNQCHANKSAKWAADLFAKWYGYTLPGLQRFAETLHDGFIGAPGANQALARLVHDRDQPPIARASALALLANDTGPQAALALRAGVGDDSPLVRRAAASALAEGEDSKRAATLAPLLDDPVREVRIEAAQALAGVPTDALAAANWSALERASGEYIEAQKLDSDRPETHLNLALLFVKQQQFTKAEHELITAMSIDPGFAPAAVNLADLDRVRGQEADGERVLRAAIARSPEDASLEHALGLSLIRQGNLPEAMAHLATATRLDPGNAHFTYVYAIALADAGRRDDAIAALQGALRQRPYDRDSLTELTRLCLEKGDERQPGCAATSPRQPMTY